MRELRIAVVGIAMGACASSAEPTSPTSTVQSSLEAMAAEVGVPPDLVMAIAIEEGGVKWPAWRSVDDDDHVPAAGMLELRHGRLDTLALGARLLGTTELALRADTELGTRAGVRVLAYLGARYGATGELASWRPALEAMSGMDDRSARDYATRVFAILRNGGEFPARGRERVQLVARDLPDSEPTTETIVGASDYPGAIWIPTSCNDKCTIGRPLGNNSVDKIIIHDTEGNWDASVATLQYDPNKSVHYIIDADGSRVGQFRPETDTTWHGGNFFYNETSIGIEHVGVASDPDGYSTALYATSRALVENIRTRWDVPLDRQHIIGHYQIPDGTQIAEDSPACDDTLDSCENSDYFGGRSNHRDPGYYWQWCQYMQQLGGSCTCNDAWPMWNCTTDKTQAVRCENGVVEIQDCTAGCEVMPIGTADVCNVAPGGGEEPPPDPGTGKDDGDNDMTGEGGCSTGGSPPLLLLVAVLGLVRRRRR